MTDYPYKSDPWGTWGSKTVTRTFINIGNMIEDWLETGMIIRVRDDGVRGCTLYLTNGTELYLAHMNAKKVLDAMKGEK